MRILLWDVHGGYTDALLGLPHEFWFLTEGGQPADHLLPRRPTDLLDNVRQVTAEQVREEPPDVVLGQRTEDVTASHQLFGDRLGREVGAVYCEHNTPRREVPDQRHPLADRRPWSIVHVTLFNALFWDCGSTATRVIEHGLPDPGHRYLGDQPRLAFVVNEPVRRWRVTGTDLLPRFTGLQVDAFGIDGDRLPARLSGSAATVRFAGNLSPAELRDALARRRAYLHLNRWTSLGLSLIESMLLGLPVLVLETTEAARAVPRGAGARSIDVDELVRTARLLIGDRDEAAARGERARAHALDRYAYGRFLDNWSACLERAVTT